MKPAANLDHGVDHDQTIEQSVINMSRLDDIQEDDPKELMSPLFITGSTENEIRIRKRNSIDTNEKGTEHPMNFFYNNNKAKIRECYHRALEFQLGVLRSTIGLMNLMAKALFWASLVALSVGVLWYSRELTIHG